MKLVAYIQAHNESEKGNLVNCLRSLTKVVDDLVIYDDGSTDNSKMIYPYFTDHFINGLGGEFKYETKMSQDGLDYCRNVLKADWALWVDADAIFSRSAEHGGIKSLIRRAEWQNKTGISIRYVNLWNSTQNKRVDNRFDDLLTVFCFKLHPDLMYPQEPGLHHRRFPDGVGHILDQEEIFALHLGFASPNRIERKYQQYKELGQSGWALDRLKSEPVLESVDQGLFPEWFNHDLIQYP